MKEKFKSFTEKHAQLWEMIKFVFTACSTTIVYYIIFWVVGAILKKPLEGVTVDSAILHFLGYDKNLALAISYLSASFLSYVASYIMNRKVTFKSNSNILMSTILFALMVVVTTAFTAWFGTFITTWANAKGGFWASGFMSNLVFPTVAMLIPFVWTYPFQKFVIYRNKKEPDEVEEVKAEETEETAEVEEVKTEETEKPEEAKTEE